MYQYTIGVVYYLFIWAVLFVLLPKSRKPILWSSVAWAHIGPLMEFWDTKEYWNPVYIVNINIASWNFGLEDYLFGFAFAGISSGIFDVLVRKAGHKEIVRFYPQGFFLLLLVGMLAVLAHAVLVDLLGVDVIHAYVIAGMLASAVIFVMRPEWIKTAILTACITAAFVWVSYSVFLLKLYPGLIEKWWNSEVLSGIFLGSVPVEEIAWAWVCGLFTGLSLRFFMDRDFRLV